MKKVVFNGLGPKETVTYKDMLIKNGGALMMEETHAQAYVSAGVAFYPMSDNEVTAVQTLEGKNAETRSRIKKKMEDIKEEDVKGGEK